LGEEVGIIAIRHAIAVDFFGRGLERDDLIWKCGSIKIN
jgi:hypothetical protein